MRHWWKKTANMLLSKITGILPSKDKSEYEGAKESMPKFHALTPTIIDDLGIYESALDFACTDKKVRNVAVSGAYGSGKSSVVETYKDKHHETKFLHISLAHFQAEANAMPDDEVRYSNIEATDNNVLCPNDKVSEGNNVKASIVTVLEGKILNQLLHQIKANRIRLTNFRTKREPSGFRRFLMISFALGVLFLGLYFFMFAQWKTLIEGLDEEFLFRNVFAFTLIPEVRFVGGLIFFMCIGIIVYIIVKRQEERPIINKANISGLELEIFKDSNDSFFDKYLSEVLYLFCKVDADVIVFEDIDRYESSIIFERLHEINRLANIKRKNRPVRFFYLIKDDIFISKDRAKFFDFIVPVVPVIDGSNSYDQFREHLEQGGILEKFDEKFLSDFSLFIDDMRILKNIYNEFMVYDSRLRKRGENLSYDKMLAMIAYKNLFPRDFSDLQLNKGFVNALFKKKGDFIALKKKQLRERLQGAESELQYANNEILDSENEVDTIYKAELSELSGKYRNNPWAKEYKEEAEELKELFAKRKNAVKNVKEGKLPELEANVSAIKLALGKVSNESLKDIITSKNADEVFSVTTKNDIDVESTYTDVKGSNYFGLLKYLVRNGHIDERYSDYMTYFYPYSLSPIDREFVLSIANQVYLGYDYALNSPEKVLVRLNILDFEKPEIRNIYLMYYLLENIKTHKELVDVLFEQLKQSAEYEFIQNVLDFTTEWDIEEHKIFFENFINKLNVSWDCLMNDILYAKNFPTVSRDRFVLLTLYFASDDTLNAVNVENILSDFISEKADFLNISNPRVEKLISRLIFLDIMFHKIDFDISNKLLFEEVYRNSLYRLTFENINQMLMQMQGIEDNEENLRHMNYTLLSQKPDSPLFSYVSSRFDEYFDVIIKNCGGKINDAEEAVIAILNHKNISDKTKESYVNVIETKIGSLNNLKLITFWELLATRSLVKHTAHNIIAFFENWNNELTDTIIDFINSGEPDYDFAFIRKEEKKALWSSFFVAVVSCDRLNDNHYRKILSTIKRVYNDGFNIVGLSDAKINILISLGITPVHKSTLEFLRENYQSTVVNFVLRDIPKYIDIIGTDLEGLYKHEEILCLLTSEASNEDKINLLDLSDDFSEANIPVVGKNYADEVKAHILRKRNTIAGITRLLSAYSKEGTLSKAQLERLVVVDVDEIFYRKEPIKIDIEMFRKIINSEDFEQDAKQKLFAVILNELNESNCKEYLPLLGLDGDYAGLFEGKRPNIIESEINERILEVFKKKGWITKFDKDEKKEGFYRVIGRKNRSNDTFDVTMD